MLKISVIFGTRPEAIKLAPVIIELQKNTGINCHVCVTAQHRQMLDQVMDVFKIMPDTDLDLMTNNQSLAGFTAKAIEGTDRYLKIEKPDFVLVQGDTTTVFCASLAALYNRIPLGHVEAGLRTGDIFSPWPEEANRALTSRLASLHFAPTATNKINLLREGIPEHNVLITGNTVIDALFLTMDKNRNNPPVITGLPAKIFAKIIKDRYVLITGHRRENHGKGIMNICEAIKDLSDTFPRIHFIYPVHLNPEIYEPVTCVLGTKELISHDRIHLIPPQSYLSFVYLMYHSHFVLTDSGGVQEEAPSFGKPVLVMRDTTERPEGIEAGVVRLIGSEREKIVGEASKLLSDENAYKKMANAVNPYGDGNASKRIVSAIIERFKK